MSPDLVSVADAPDATSSVQRSRAAIGAIIVCVLANMIDGFDVLAIASTAPIIAHEWGVGPSLLGVLFSAGLAGVTLGSLLLSPLADRFGRRRLAMSCLAAMAGSMSLCAVADTVAQLMILRLITGLGVGGILPTLNSVVAEVAPPGRRNLAISVFTAAYPLGSMIGGALAVLLITRFGWQSIFLLGGLATALVLVSHWYWLPKNGSGEVDEPTKIPMRALFDIQRLPTTALISGAFFLHMMSVFFVLNWTPRLVEMSGQGMQAGVTAALFINLGSLVGGITYGPLADSVGWRRVAPAYALAFAVSLVIFANRGASVMALYGTATLLGAAMGGVMTSLYALAPVVFPPSVRVGGTGVAIGIGRCGGMLGPLLAGYGIAAGATSSKLYVICAVAAGVVAGIIQSLSAWLASARSRRVDEAGLYRSSSRTDRGSVEAGHRHET